MTWTTGAGLGNVAYFSVYREPTSGSAALVATVAVASDWHFVDQGGVLSGSIAYRVEAVAQDGTPLGVATAYVQVT